MSTEVTYPEFKRERLSEYVALYNSKVKPECRIDLENLTYSPAFRHGEYVKNIRTL